jgi:hypothetical protein
MNQSSNAPQPKIFIAGDSWGCGEYNQVNGPAIGISHKGIEQYFIDDGFDVVNTSLGGTSNASSIDRLHQQLQLQHCPGDIILWIQTEAVRDLVRYDDTRLLNGLPIAVYPVTEPIQQAGGILKLYKQLVAKNYQVLNELAKQYNTTVYSIGGCSSLFTDVLQGYSNIFPLIESCVELISGKHPDFQFIGLWTIDDIKLSTYTSEFAGQVINEFDTIVKWERIFDQPGFINRHPDRNGYKIIYNAIKEKLKL